MLTRRDSTTRTRSSPSSLSMFCSSRSLRRCSMGCGTGIICVIVCFDLYKRYCTARLRRLYKSLEFTQSHYKVYCLGSEEILKEVTNIDLVINLKLRDVLIKKIHEVKT